MLGHKDRLMFDQLAREVGSLMVFHGPSLLSLSLSFTHTCTHACTHTHTRARAHTHIRMHTHTNTHTHTHAHAPTHTHMHTCTHACACTDTRTDTHAHTHTCTHIMLVQTHMQIMFDNLAMKPIGSLIDFSLRVCFVCGNRNGNMKRKEVNCYTIWIKILTIVGFGFHENELFISFPISNCNTNAIMNEEWNGFLIPFPYFIVPTMPGVHWSISFSISYTHNKHTHYIMLGFTVLIFH